MNTGFPSIHRSGDGHQAIVRMLDVSTIRRVFFAPEVEDISQLLLGRTYELEIISPSVPMTDMPGYSVTVYDPKQGRQVVIVDDEGRLCVDEDEIFYFHHDGLVETDFILSQLSL